MKGHRRLKTSPARKHQRGGSVLEISLLLPWIFFLFVGVMDFGYFGYALTSTQNAARVAAEQTSQDTLSQSQSLACSAAKQELAWMINNANFNAGSCTATPLTVTQQTLTNATTPACADCGRDATASSSLVSVAYQTIPLIPIPLILNQQFTFTRTVEMRILAQ